MNIDKNKISALSELGDREFGELIKKAILTAGGSEAQALSAAAAAPIIKYKLKNAGDRELQQLVSFIGEKTANDILGNVKGGDKNR